MTSHTTVGGACRVSMPDHESLCKTIFGITLAEVEMVACLVAAQACGRAGASLAELAARVGHDAPRGMGYLERNLWVRRVARVERSPAWVWAATPLAIKRLELVGWKRMLFSADELPRADASLPGLLRPPAEPVEEERAAS